MSDDDRAISNAEAKIDAVRALSQLVEQAGDDSVARRRARVILDAIDRL